MQVVAKVFHNKGADECWKFSPDTSALVYQHDVVVEAGTPEQVLERVFRAANRVDGSDIEQVPNYTRSLSTGDVVSLGEGEFYSCEFVGWEKVSNDQFYNAVSRGFDKEVAK